MPAPIPDISARPGSALARELQQVLAGRRFGARLERQYVMGRLAEHRALIRVTCVLGALLSAFSAARKGLSGELTGELSLQIVLVLLASVILAVVACTPLFERFYLPLARVVVPVRNALAAAFITAIAVLGQFEALMVLPLMVVGPFFFLGLPFRVAFLSVAATITAFGVAAAVLGLALETAVFALALLLAVAVASVVAARHLDERARKSFLENQLAVEQAEHDALTGIKNRRVFDEQFVRLWQRAIDQRRSIAVLLIDVDHFKDYNDRHGHQAGDRALCRVADVLARFVTGPLDVLARYGGEEFVVVLNDVAGRQAASVGERMRRAVSELTVEPRGGIPAGVTISIGVAALRPGADRGPRGALQLADQALYEAKVRGRNRVELMEDKDYRLLVTGVFSRRSAPPGT